MPIDEANRRLRDLLIKHEGLRRFPYVDSVGKWTIGIGRCIEDVGISDAEAFYLLENDIKRVQEEALAAFAWFKSISTVRQDVVLSMIFNMGLTRFLGFKKLIAALSAQNYELAATEMLASVWSRQVGIRARELARMMQTGSYPPSA